MQKFLAVKNYKLYANITYATSSGTQKSFSDDVFLDVYIAVVDIENLVHQKPIKIEDTGSIAYINDNNITNRYYILDGTAATPLFTVKADGSFSGLYKLASNN